MPTKPEAERLAYPHAKTVELVGEPDAKADEPRINPIGDTIIMDWPSTGVRVVVARIDEKHGELKGEMTVSSRPPWAKGVINVWKVQLPSSRSRAEVIRDLKEACKDPDVDWPNVVNTACVTAMEIHRNGQPEVDLWTVDPDSVPDILDPFIPGDGVTSIFTKGGGRKSTTAMAMGLSIASNVEIVGSPVAGKAFPVIYVDYEDTPPIHAERMRAIWNPLGIDGRPPIWWKGMFLSFREGVEAIRGIIARREAKFGIVDSMILARGGDMNDSDGTIKTYLALRSTGIPWLAVDHVNRKDGESGEPEMAAGSSTNHNSARRTHFLETIGEPGDDKAVLIIHNKKTNRGKLNPRQVYKVRYVNKGGKLVELHYEKSNPEAIPEVMERMPVASRIKYELRDGPTRTERLAEKLNVKPDQVEQVLKTLDREGKVIQLPQGWGLKADRFQPGD